MAEFRLHFVYVHLNNLSSLEVRFQRAVQTERDAELRRETRYARTRTRRQRRHRRLLSARQYALQTLEAVAERRAARLHACLHDVERCRQGRGGNASDDSRKQTREEDARSVFQKLVVQRRVDSKEYGRGRNVARPRAKKSTVRRARVASKLLRYFRHLDGTRDHDLREPPDGASHRLSRYGHVASWSPPVVSAEIVRDRQRC